MTKLKYFFSLFQKKSTYQNNFISLILPLAFGLAALICWINIPIYPDEVAMHLHLGRYIQDSRLMTGLYQLCTSNYRQIVGIFIIPAYIISFLDINLSINEFRFINIIIIILIIIINSFISIKSGFFSNITILIGFIGVAGSGLIFARYETFLYLNIFICLFTFSYLLCSIKSIIYDSILIFLLVISCLMSFYSHIQGILFIPLTFYCFFRIINKYSRLYYSISISIVIAIYFTYLGLNFNHFNCEEYPSIINFTSSASYTFNQIFSAEYFNLLFKNINKYFSSFLYLNNYTINYIPGTSKNFWFINLFIIVLLAFNLILGFLVFITILYLLLRGFFYKTLNNNVKNSISDSFTVLFLMAPLFILLIFDSVYNFYRVFFINFILGVSVSIFLSRLTLPFIFSKVIRLYNSFLIIFVLVSIVINFLTFTRKFAAPVFFTGPSVSNFTDWKLLNKDIGLLASECEVNLTKGKIVVDDLTYNSLKTFPLLYPITYLSLQAYILNVTPEVVLLKIKPNYVLASCLTMEDLTIGLPITSRRNSLCCHNFVTTPFR